MTSPAVPSTPVPSTPHFADLERSLAAAGPAPRLIWYGPDGERIELSGAVLLNWAAKTANLLVEECDVASGTTVRLALPVHWRTMAIALGAWQAGARVRVGSAPGAAAGSGERVGAPDDGGVAVHVDVAPAADGAPRADHEIVVALGALDLRYTGDLPGQTLDYAGLVRAFGDGFGGEPATGPLRLVEDDRAVALGPAAADRIDQPRRARALDASRGVGATLVAAVDAWLAGVAVLITDDAARFTDAVLTAERAVRV